MEQGGTQRRLRRQTYPARRVIIHFETDHQVGQRHTAGGLFGPFGEFQAGAGKDVAKAGIGPFARVAETVKVKVPDMEIRQFIGLHHGVSRAFDASLHPQCPQQMTHQRGLACAQITLQFNVGQAQFRHCRQRAGKFFGGGFIAPQQGFYNGQVINTIQQLNGSQWVSRIQDWGRALGFSQIGVAGVDLTDAEPGLSAWLAAGFHGDMFYMASHGLKRARPAELVPGTVRVITARMDYLPASTPEGWQALEFDRLKQPTEAIVSVYARGRDYHKVMRQRLQKLSDQIAAALGPLGYRVFTDSAPVLEAELASLSGLGWRGKHTLLLSREAGSTFFLGEIFVDMALPVTEPVANHCGSCSACIDICPTRAIVAPYRLDARRCISYLTIEHAGPIPLELRPLMGNRIYGCDDCQLICPWNKFAKRSALPDFDARAGLAGSQLIELFAWSEEAFLRFTEGSPIRRIGHERWLRNIAVALGNALRVVDASAAKPLLAALALRAEHPSSLVREHVAWALDQKN